MAKRLSYAASKEDLVSNSDYIDDIRYTGPFHYRDVMEQKETVLDNVMESMAAEPPVSQTLVFSGLSGALLGAHLCFSLNLTPVYIRKVGECSHNPGHLAVGEMRGLTYVIVDDLIDTGKTIRHMLKTMSSCFKKSKCEKIILYNQGYMEGDFPKTGYNHRNKTFLGIPVVSLSLDT